MFASSGEQVKKISITIGNIMPRPSRSKADPLVGADAVWDSSWTDPVFTEEFVEGALEWAEALYATVLPYREGWAHIHPQDREEWLASFDDLREPFELLVRWRERGLLSRSQMDRFTALLVLKDEYDGIIAGLMASGRSPWPIRSRPVADDYDLLS